VIRRNSRIGQSQAEWRIKSYEVEEVEGEPFSRIAFHFASFIARRTGRG